MANFPIVAPYIATKTFPGGFIDKEQFSKYIHSLNDNSLLDSFITDLDNKKQLNYDTNITINSEITDKYLHTLGFKWPLITEDYIDNFLKI